MKLLSQAILVVFILGVVFVAIPILLARHHAESLRHMLAPNMNWPDVAAVLDSNKHWASAGFHGDKSRCGLVLRKDAGYMLTITANEKDRPHISQISSMKDPSIVDQSASCERLFIGFSALPTPEDVFFKVSLTTGGKIGTIAPVEDYAP